MPKKKPRQPDAAEERRGMVINAAYGLIEGMLWPVDAPSATLAEWNKPEVQEAALKAADAFLAQLGK